MDVKEFLSKISDVPHVTGYENELADFLLAEFSKFGDAKRDELGNVILRVKGDGPKVMFCAHMDEIGLIVTHILKNGFVKFARMGGIDPRNIIAKEVTIHGRHSGAKLFGVIGQKPPHLIKESEKNKTIDINDLSIDTGYSAKALESLIRPGDVITFNVDVKELLNNRLTGRAFDNSASVAAMYVCMRRLADFARKADIYYVASVQEEVGTRGAITAGYSIKPDIAIAIDVGFGRTPELAEHDSVELDGGAVIHTGVNINRKLFERLRTTAKENGIAFQVSVEPYNTGTDARALQITEGGAITGLLGIPLKYMHSTVETISIADVNACGRLMSEYIIGGDLCF